MVLLSSAILVHPKQNYESTIIINSCCKIVISVLFGGSFVRITFIEIKDGAHSCHCTYVLRISRYSGFLLVMLTNTVIFLRGLKLSGESRSL